MTQVPKKRAYDQVEYHAIKMFAVKLERAASSWWLRWPNRANQRVMDDFIHLAESIRKCLDDNVEFTVGVTVQIELPDFESDDEDYAEDYPPPF